MNKINFVFCVHMHQPVGNFDHVFESSFERCYQPFLDLMVRHPRVKFCAHYSGSLLEWIEQNHVEYFTQIRKAVDSGQCELLGGGFYEPILTMLPEPDARGQIEMMTRYLNRSFGASPTGMWLAERVWEQPLAHLLADSGMAYTVLDDYHFKGVGMRDEDLTGYFLTEDQGKVVSLFPLKEALRYAIPFKDPEWTIEHLRSLATPDGERVVVYADDGEKFGVWPETYKHVFENGWLERFLNLLEQSSDCIQVATFRDVMQRLRPAGKIYLHDASYREMEEWSVLPPGRPDFESVQEDLKRMGRYDQIKHVLRGGSWRNFKVRYPEANVMYGRMFALSDWIRQAEKKGASVGAAQTDLYKAQCNCSYWHGVFGGLYLPHLREAVYKNLIQSENFMDGIGPNVPVQIRTLDMDLDGTEDARLYNGFLNIFITPACGGHMVELDVREKLFNVMGVLSRRPEAYHHLKVPDAHTPGQARVLSIHDIEDTRGQDWNQHLYYDRHARHSLIDHFFAPDTTLEQVYRQQYPELGDFASGPYTSMVTRKERNVTIHLKREGVLEVGGKRHPLEVSKDITLAEGQSEFEICTSIKVLDGEEVESLFGIEFNLSGLSQEREHAFLHYGDGVPVGSLASLKDLTVDKSLCINDNWRELQIGFSFSRSAQVWTHPIYTVSRSEKGFETNYQGTSIIPRWPLRLAPGQSWKLVIKMKIGKRP